MMSEPSSLSLLQGSEKDLYLYLLGKLENLSPEQRQEALSPFLKSTKPASSDRIPYCPHSPHPKQREFLELDCFEAMFGGAAGGGKSDALLMDALQYVDVPGYAAILFRRTFADLEKPGALMDRALHWFKPHQDLHWNGRRWLFPSGATISFGYLQHENDKFAHQSAEYQYIGFDELTQFTSTMYAYLKSRLRRTRGLQVPLRLRSASNPGGIGHEWVKSYFVDPETRGPNVVFLASRLADNPSLDEDEYLATLIAMGELDPINAKRLAEGDWTVRPEGTMFREGWFDIIRSLPEKLRILRYWDFAASEKKTQKDDPDWTVGAKVGYDPWSGVYVVLDVVRLRGTPATVEQTILQTAREDGPEVEVWLEQEPAASGIALFDHYHRRVLQGYSVFPYKPTGSKEARANPVSSLAQRGLVLLLLGAWNRAFLNEAVLFPTEGAHDDQVDAVSSAIACLKRSLLPAQIVRKRQEPAFDALNM